MSLLKAKKTTTRTDKEYKRAHKAATLVERQLHVNVPKPLYDKLYLKARQEGHTVSALIRAWAEKYVR